MRADTVRVFASGRLADPFSIGFATSGVFISALPRSLRSFVNVYGRGSMLLKTAE
jgi:hypothetical protein